MPKSPTITPSSASCSYANIFPTLPPPECDPSLSLYEDSFFDDIPLHILTSFINSNPTSPLNTSTPPLEIFPQDIANPTDLQKLESSNSEIEHLLQYPEEAIYLPSTVEDKRESEDQQSVFTDEPLHSSTFLATPPHPFLINPLAPKDSVLIAPKQTEETPLDSQITYSKADTDIASCPSSSSKKSQKNFIIYPHTMLISIVEEKMEDQYYTPKEKKYLKKALMHYRVCDITNTFIENILSKYRSPYFIKLFETTLIDLLKISLKEINTRFPKLHERLSQINLLKEYHAASKSPRSIEIGIRSIHLSSQRIDLAIKWWLHTLASAKEVFNAQWSEINLSLSIWTSCESIEYPLSRYMHKILTSVLLLPEKDNKYIFQTSIPKKLMEKKEKSLEIIVKEFYANFSLDNLREHQAELMKDNIFWDVYLSKLMKNSSKKLLFLDHTKPLEHLLIHFPQNITALEFPSDQMELIQEVSNLSHDKSCIENIKNILSTQPFSSCSIGDFRQDILELLLSKIKLFCGPFCHNSIRLLKKTLLLLQMNYDIIPFTIAANIESLSILASTPKLQTPDFDNFLHKLFLSEKPPLRSELMAAIKFNLFSMSSTTGVLRLKKEHIFMDQMLWLSKSDLSYQVHPLTEELKKLILIQPSYHNPNEIFLFPKKFQQTFSEHFACQSYKAVDPNISLTKIKDHFKTHIVDGRHFFAPKVPTSSLITLNSNEMDEIQQRRSDLNKWAKFILEKVNLDNI